MTKGVATELDPLSLERQGCFSLAITNRAVLAVYRPLLEPLGLTHPPYPGVLALLGSPHTTAPGAAALVGQADRRGIAAGSGHTVANAQALGGARPHHAHPKHRR